MLLSTLAWPPSADPQGHRKQQAERRLVQFLCQVFVMSWTGALNTGFH